MVNALHILDWFQCTLTCVSNVHCPSDWGALKYRSEWWIKQQSCRVHNIFTLEIEIVFGDFYFLSVILFHWFISITLNFSTIIESTGRKLYDNGRISILRTSYNTFSRQFYCINFFLNSVTNALSTKMKWNYFKRYNIELKLDKKPIFFHRLKQYRNNKMCR